MSFCRILFSAPKTDLSSYFLYIFLYNFCIQCIQLVRWLLLCVNWPGLWDFWINGRRLFMDGSVTEISISISRLSKEICPHHGGGQIEQKWRKGQFSLSLQEQRHPFFSCPVTQELLVLRSLDFFVLCFYTRAPFSTTNFQPFGLKLNYTTSFHDSPACIGQIVGFLSLCNHMVSFHNKSPLTHVYISYWFFFWTALSKKCCSQAPWTFAYVPWIQIYLVYNLLIPCYTTFMNISFFFFLGILLRIVTNRVQFQRT